MLCIYVDDINVSINLRVEMVGVQILTASEWVHFLCTVQLPERSPGCKSRLGKMYL